MLVVCRQAFAGEGVDTALQLSSNPPMQIITNQPPEPDVQDANFEIRDGFRLVSTMKQFRIAIKQSNQKIRVRPGVYRAADIDEPMVVPMLHSTPDKNGKLPIKQQQHIFAVTGSNNHFDMRGVVIETPTSLQGRLSMTPHLSDSWHINGSGNTFEGGYFRNVTDQSYPDYRVTECEFEVCNDNNTFLDCTFFIKGSVPFGYSDYYGKGGPNFGRLNKHSFMSIQNANNTKLIGCKVYMQSFGHCLHFHKVDGVLIKDCYLTGSLRPTNDIFKEIAGRAKDYDYKIMYRGERPIPHDNMIPLTEDGVRSYDDVKNITVTGTTVERMRGCFQLLCTGDITLTDVTVLESGDFSYDLSAGNLGRVVMKGCKGDIAYNPLFNLTRGDLPRKSLFEVTILSPAKGVSHTPRTSLGIICGIDCKFVLHDGTT